jgi:hypothetical protein
MKISSLGAVCAVALLSSTAAYATTVTSILNVDNKFTAYISTDDSVAGTQFSNGQNWPAAISGTAALTDGVTNYLHILAEDLGGIAMLLGTFTLSDANFSFANGLQIMLSGDAGLEVSTTGWGSYGATTDLGPNGTSPWGTRGPSLDADYVWSADAQNDNLVYFSAAISYDVATVPVPAALPLLALGLGGLGLLGRRKA